MIERPIINACLVLCVALGLICLIAIALPQQLARNVLASQPAIMTLPPANLDSVVDLHAAALAPSRPLSATADAGVVAHFTPAPDPRRDEQPRPAPIAKEAVPEESAASLSEMMGRTTRFEHPTSSLTSTTSTTPLPSWLTVRDELAPDVAFWRDIYAAYDSNQIVMHDAEHVAIVYRILDLTTIATDPNVNDLQKEAGRQQAIDAAREEIKSLLAKLAATTTPVNLSDEEWRIWRLFRNIPGGAKKFIAAADRVRAQVGQKDKFLAGLKYSGRYMGAIEAIFAEAGLPRELTRLVFVESMFDQNARSSVGAAGVWQFMRATARLYDLSVNQAVDLRLDPILESRAAARLLKENYDVLGSWPLAINAYNAGRGRLHQAVDTLGTKDIAVIVRHFHHPAYAFASRNFFMEFLAAVDVAEHARQYFGAIDFDPPLAYEEVMLSKAINLPQAAHASRIPIDMIAVLNPALQSGTIAGHASVPKGFPLRIPDGDGQPFIAALGANP